MGTPGVGKSYICRVIEKKIIRQPDPLALTTPGLDKSFRQMFPDNVLKTGRAGYFFMRNPSTTWRLGREVFRGKGSLRIGRCTKFVNLLSECQRTQAADRSNSLLTEQGVLQGIWSLEMMAEVSVHRHLMEISIRWLPDAVILVDAEPTQNKHQLQHRQRGQSTFDRLHDEELAQAIERGNLIRDEIVTLWAELVPNGHYLYYKNQPQGDVHHVFDWLDAHVR